MNGLKYNDILTIIVSVVACIFAFFIGIIIFYNIEKEKLEVKRRVSDLFEKQSLKFIKEKKEKVKKDTYKKGVFKGRIIEVIGDELLTADIIMKPEEFFIIWILLAFVPSGLFALIVKQVIGAIVLAILGLILPPLYIKKQKGKRIRAFESQLSDALVTIGNCLKSGLTFQLAMETIATEMPSPIGREFARVVREIKYGSSIERALTSMVDRLESGDLMLTVNAVLIQRQVGGNLSEILSNISDTIRDRLKVKNEIRVLTATGRMSGMVIGLLPIAIGGLLLIINPSYITLFFYNPLGRKLLMVAVALELIGFIVVRKTVTVKF